jgi:8-oxo-(d)GTP phosphatase
MSEIRELTSAGGVVVRRAGDNWETLVLHRISPGEWRLPKGKMHTGETLEATAMREVAEETGLPAELASYVCATSYSYSTRREGQVNKTVHYYLMRVSREAPLQLEARNFDVGRWLPLDAAIECLSFESEKHVLREARGAIEVLD